MNTLPRFAPERKYFPNTIENDPLAGKTTKQVYEDCVWFSNEPTECKIFLLCIGRYFDADGHASSMSYTQVARDCSMGERTAKKLAKYVRGTWLKIEVGKGYHVPGKGRQNLYHAIVPADVVEGLRDHRRTFGPSITIDRRKVTVVAEHEVTTISMSGVHQEHPGGVHARHPEVCHSGTGVHATTERGAPGAHVLLSTANKKEVVVIGKQDSDQCLEDHDRKTDIGGRSLVPVSGHGSLPSNSITPPHCIANENRLMRWYGIAANFGYRPNDPTPRKSYERCDTDPGFITTVEILLRSHPEALVEDAIDLTLADMAVMGFGTGRGPSSAQSMLFQRAEGKIRKRIIDTKVDVTAGKSRADGTGGFARQRKSSSAMLNEASASVFGKGNTK